MAEVYTISGFGEPTPEQYEQMEHQNVQVVQKQQARASIPPALLLQNALKALGDTHGDAALSKLKQDGIIGPGTTKATNYAFSTYLGAPNVMSTAYVRQHVNYLQGQVTAYVEAHGGTVPPPWVGSRKKSLAPIPLPQMPAIPGMSASDNKWVWWVVGGVSILVVLTVVVKAVRRPPAQSAKA